MTTHAEELAMAMLIFEGRSGDRTRDYYARLSAIGPAGELAVNLFRAQKNSSLAKEYRRRSSKGAAYDSKQWAMNNLVAILLQHAPALGITWGWKTDPRQAYHRSVLYIDLPTGQCSFHTDRRGDGPDYPADWDGIEGAVPGRILTWCVQLLVQRQGVTA